METALGAAQDFERANHTALGLDGVASDAHRKLCPASALPAPLPANATTHQVVSCLFVQAFNFQVASATALTTWQTGQPMPSVVGNLKGEVDTIFGVASGLTSNTNQQGWLQRVQAAVDAALAVVTMLGGA